MKTPNFLAKTPVDVPNRSGFSMPHEYMTTGRCGTLQPVLCKPMVPGETMDLSLMFEAELPPMVSNFFGRVDLCFEAFFVPNYLLWGGWDDFFTHPTSNPIYPEGTNIAAKPKNIPHVICRSSSQSGSSAVLKVCGRNTLGDYLGIKTLMPTSSNSQLSVSALPFLAYHRAYHDHYRNTVVQAPVFYKPAATDGSVATIPYRSGVNTAVTSGDNVSDFLWNESSVSPVRLGDGVLVTDLRQANWDLDYFTAATPQPQAGGASTLTFDVVVDPQTGDGTGSFSLAALRSVNAIQVWMERNNLVG